LEELQRDARQRREAMERNRVVDTRFVGVIKHWFNGDHGNVPAAGVSFVLVYKIGTTLSAVMELGRLAK
jgi:hypothetical protein